MKVWFGRLSTFNLFFFKVDRNLKFDDYLLYIKYWLKITTKKTKKRFSFSLVVWYNLQYELIKQSFNINDHIFGKILLIKYDLKILTTAILDKSVVLFTKTCVLFYDIK